MYSDSTLEIMDSLGKATITRASQVEFDNAKRKWIAVLSAGLPKKFGKAGTVIAETLTRKEAIDLEVAYLKSRM